MICGSRLPDPKLEYHRDSGSEGHLRDVSAILEISGEKIDTPEVERWVERLGLQKEYGAASWFDR